MREYTFTLKFRVREAAADLDDLIERLGTAGCDDALIGVGSSGRLALEFVRMAGSAKEARESALRDIRTVLPDAELIEVAPDYVGMTEVAQFMNTSWQYIAKLRGQDVDFPLPVQEGSQLIFRLAAVLHWMEQKGKRVEPALKEVAEENMRFNDLAQGALYKKFSEKGVR